MMIRHVDKVLVVTVASAFSLVVLSRASDAGGCRRRAVCTQALPCYDYQSGVTPNRGTLASYPATVSDVVGVAEVRQKLFPPLADELTVGDCTLRNPQLLVDSTGSFVLSFRAINTAHTAEPTQKAESLKAGAAKAEERNANQVVPVRHHRLRVTACLYTGTATVPAKDTKRATGVLLKRLSSSPFILSAREEQTLTFSGLEVTRRQFDLANQVEFELEVDPVIGVLEARGARDDRLCR